MGWIIALILFGMLASIVEYVAILLPVAIVGMVVYGFIENKNNKKKAALRKEELNHLIKDLNKNGLPVVSTSLILGPRERCYYHNSGNRFITSRRVVKYEGGSSGVSVRVAKGFTFRSGSSRGVPIRGDVTDTFHGEIAITNKRIVFLASKGFEITYGQITAIDYYSDAIALQVKNTRYVLTSPDLEYMQMIVDEVVERHKLKRA